MNLTDMHIMFRQFAQQMGMQNVRAILPEQIDLLLNTSISDIVDEVVRTNVGITNDRVVTDNSKISQVNALKGLYKVDEIKFNNAVADDITTTVRLTVSSFSDSDVIDLYICTNVVENEYDAGSVLNYKADVVKHYRSTKAGLDNLTNDNPDIITSSRVTGSTLILDLHNLKAGDYTLIAAINGTDAVSFDTNTNTVVYEWNTVKRAFSVVAVNPFIFKKSYAYSGRLLSNPEFVFPNYRYIVDFSISYIKSDVGYLNGEITLNEDDDFVTNYFPVRLIDDAYLAEAQQDWILKARLRTPVITIYNRDNVDTFDLYIDTFKNSGSGYLLDSGLLPYTLRMSYIKQPNVVKYVEDYGEANVECDLAENLHVNIVKHAVELYNDSIRGSVATEQAKQQRAQQERYRNQNRNEQD